MAIFARSALVVEFGLVFGRCSVLQSSELFLSVLRRIGKTTVSLCDLLLMHASSYSSSISNSIASSYDSCTNSFYRSFIFASNSLLASPLFHNLKTMLLYSLQSFIRLPIFDSNFAFSSVKLLISSRSIFS